MSVQSLKIRLHVLSPIHIGCDDVYEPTSFVIDEKKNKLIEFDPMDFVKSLSVQERQRFSMLCMQGSISSIVSIYKFISNKQIKGREIEISTGIIPHYKKVKDLPTNDERKVRQELNQFTISRTAYNPHTDTLFISGSSIKGAIRTAYLSKLANVQNTKNCWNKYLHGNELENEHQIYFLIGKKKVAKRLEEDLLGGSFDTDPFRMVKVSDFMPVGDAKSKIVYAINRKRKASRYEARGPFQVLEAIKKETVFEGIINIYQPESLSKIKKPITEKELLASVNDFYKPLFNNENEALKEMGIQNNGIIDEFKGMLGKSVFLVRIGRHSGAEAVTIEGNRHIKIMQGRNEKPKYLDHATTFWLAADESKPKNNNGLLPFGWAVMEVVN